MALNGLDSADVNLAFQSALQDSGGWYVIALRNNSHDFQGHGRLTFPSAL